MCLSVAAPQPFPDVPATKLRVFLTPSKRIENRRDVIRTIAWVAKFAKSLREKEEALSKSLSVTLVVIGFVVLMIVACNGRQSPEQSVMVTAANETAAMARIRAIAAAEARYQIDSGGEYGTMEQLIEKRFLSDPSSGKLTGYRFDVQLKPGGFKITAVPEKFGVSGNRSFYMDETNVLHAADKKGAPAAATDPEV